jgi:putative FmdB family regulatory protein
MPIYEFYCADCHTIYSFLARTPGASRRPDCPRCGRAALERRPSAFAISKGRTEEPASEDTLPDDAGLERAVAAMAPELDGLDENDPRGAARLMRRLYDRAGLPLGPRLREALGRLEAGEDPETIDAELGDVLESEAPFGGAGEAGAPAGGMRALRRRALPPRTDPELYEL